MKIKNLSLILLASLLLGACGNKDAKPAEKPKQEVSQVKETKQEESQVDETKTGVKVVKDDGKKPNEEEKEKVPEFATNADEALKIFHDHNFGDGSNDAINIDKLKVKILDRGIIYSIEGFKDGKEYQLKINNNGEILEEKIEDDDDNKKLAIDFTKIISGVDAMDKALEGQGEKAWVKEYEMKIEDGKAVYDIYVENGEDVKIDAESGEII